MIDRTASVLFVMSAILIVMCGIAAIISAYYRYQPWQIDHARAAGAAVAILGGGGLAGIGIARLVRLVTPRHHRRLGKAR